MRKIRYTAICFLLTLTACTPPSDLSLTGGTLDIADPQTAQASPSSQPSAHLPESAPTGEEPAETPEPSPAPVTQPEPGTVFQPGTPPMIPESDGSIPPTEIQVVELPPERIEVIKEVYVNAPLESMDVSKNDAALRSELNKKHAFQITLNGKSYGLTLKGGEYCYGFVSRQGYLLDYYFELPSENGDIIFSYNFPLLGLNSDKTSVEQLDRELMYSFLDWHSKKSGILFDSITQNNNTRAYISDKAVYTYEITGGRTASLKIS